MSEWQPIDTAPKDGQVLLWQAGYEPYIGIFHLGQWWTDDSSFNDNFYPPTCNPTHWMPLPPPPKEPTLSKSLIHSVNHVVEPREGESSMQGIRCPNANDEQCRYPDCKCHG